MPVPIILNFDEAAGDSKKHQISYPEPLRFISARVSDVAGVAAHASDYVDFQVLGNDQTTAIAKYSTASAADGALSAGVPAALTNQNPDKMDFDANEMIEISAIKAANGQVVDATITAVFEVRRTL